MFIIKGYTIEKPAIRNYKSSEKAKAEAEKCFRRLSDATGTKHY